MPICPPQGVAKPKNNISLLIYCTAPLPSKIQVLLACGKLKLSTISYKRAKIYSLKRAASAMYIWNEWRESKRLDECRERSDCQVQCKKAMAQPSKNSEILPTAHLCIQETYQKRNVLNCLGLCYGMRREATAELLTSDCG